jgi:hypothetical protein
VPAPPTIAGDRGVGHSLARQAGRDAARRAECWLDFHGYTRSFMTGFGFTEARL